MTCGMNCIRFKYDLIYSIQSKYALMMSSANHIKQAILEDKLNDVNLTTAMTSWTKQKGHPVVHVRILNSTHVSIRQNRFVLDSNFQIALLNE